MPTIQRIVVIISIPLAMLAGLLVGIFALGVQKPAEASVPAQVAELGAGWSVHNFRTITFEENNWQQMVSDERSKSAFGIAQTCARTQSVMAS